MMGKKEVYIEKLEAQLKEWSAKIESAKAEKLRAEGNKEYMEQVGKLRSRREEALARLQKLRESGEGAWEDLRQGADRSWAELKAALEKAKERMGREKTGKWPPPCAFPGTTDLLS
jgi:uncharacterized coiled-coil DUF342 family protein